MLNFRGLIKKVRKSANNSTSSTNSKTSNEDLSSATPLSYFQEDESTRAWGDELSGELLYTILLKRVRYSKNTNDGLQWETQKVRLLKAGSLERLVDHLAAAFLHDDVNFLSIFLATYRTFVPPTQVVDMLLERYEKLAYEEIQDTDESYSASDCEAIKKSILRVLEMWIEKHPEDWQQPPKFQLVQKTLSFCTNFKEETRELESKTRQVLRDSRKKRNTEYPGIQLKPIKPNDLDRTSVNKDAALHFLRHISEVEMAKSLLAYDVRLFRRVIPWQCLGSVWSRREQRSSSEIHTVKATVKQFNHVVYIVLATVLSPCLSLAQRAKIVEKWILVAQESRKRKNFSSYHAIISGLQTHAVHRLEKTWAEVQSYISNQFQQMRADGTMKEKSSHESSSVPYLGSILTDLTYVDTAHPDYITDDTREVQLINFEKRRKEFELLTTISLLQMGCESMEREKASQKFQDFISLVQPLTDSQGYELSQMAENGKIEPEKYGSLLQHSFSTLMDESDSDTISERSSNAPDLLDLRSKMKSPRSSIMSANPRNSETNGNYLNISNQKTDSISPRTSSSSESVIVRVTVEDPRVTESGVNYRCIRLNEHDRAKAVLSSALEKHCLDQEDPSKWKLCQKLPGRELSLPDNANVFFGLDNTHAKEGKMIEFILRRKTPEEIREMEREIRARKNKIYEAQGVTLKGLAQGQGATKSLARHESLAAKIGSSSMANLNPAKEEIRDSSVNSIKSKSLANLNPR